MLISTKGRYALRVIIDLAEHMNGSFIPMKDVAERQNISLKYIERIMPSLAEAGLVESASGRGGGYRFAGRPDRCRVGDVLRASGEDLSPVACLSGGRDGCSMAASCRTLDMWRKYRDMTVEYFDGITIADLMKTSWEPEYVI
ncbi:MAG: RrF2 family transcriptional regulator [Oscillospiraceae bacterium]|jgi:Rrf2 family protein